MAGRLQQQQNSLFGTDFAFPMMTNNRGQLATISGLDNLQQAIDTWIHTTVGELLYYRERGVGVEKFVHSDIDYAVNQIPGEIERGLMLWEPRIKSVTCSVVADHTNNIIRVTVNYLPIGYAIAQNLVTEVKI